MIPFQVSDIAEAQSDEAADPNNKAKPPLKQNLSPLVSMTGSKGTHSGTSGRGCAHQNEDQVIVISCLHNILKR